MAWQIRPPKAGNALVRDDADDGVLPKNGALYICDFDRPDSCALVIDGFLRGGESGRKGCTGKRPQKTSTRPIVHGSLLENRA